MLNVNPSLDACEYEIELPYGMVDVSLANVIVEAIYLQVVEHDWTYAILWKRRSS
jgi:hypothetical protein